jgi:hypothetical protein
MIFLEDTEIKDVCIINGSIIYNGVTYNYGEHGRRIQITNTQSTDSLDLKFRPDKHKDGWYNKHQAAWYLEAANAIVAQWDQVLLNDITITVHDIEYNVSQR